jgi:hypothetical protein
MLCVLPPVRQWEDTRTGPWHRNGHCEKMVLAVSMKVKPRAFLLGLATRRALVSWGEQKSVERTKEGRGFILMHCWDFQKIGQHHNFLRAGSVTYSFLFSVKVSCTEQEIAKCLMSELVMTSYGSPQKREIKTKVPRPLGMTFSRNVCQDSHGDSHHFKSCMNRTRRYGCPCGENHKSKGGQRAQYLTVRTHRLSVGLGRASAAILLRNFLLILWGSKNVQG